MHKIQVYKIDKLYTESLCTTQIYIHLKKVYNSFARLREAEKPLNAAILPVQHSDPLAAQSELTEAAGGARQTARTVNHKEREVKTLSQKNGKNSKASEQRENSFTRADLDKAYFEGVKHGFQRAFQWITKNDEFIVDFD